MTTATKQTAILTTQLKNKTVVLAKNDKRFGINPITYMNISQARKKLETLRSQNVNCYITGSSVFYIAIQF